MKRNRDEERDKNEMRDERRDVERDITNSKLAPRGNLFPKSKSKLGSVGINLDYLWVSGVL